MVIFIFLVFCRAMPVCKQSRPSSDARVAASELCLDCLYIFASLNRIIDTVVHVHQDFYSVKIYKQINLAPHLHKQKEINFVFITK